MNVVRDKPEKSRGHIEAQSVKNKNTDDDFADLQMAPAFPGTETIIGTPTRPNLFWGVLPKPPFSQLLTLDLQMATHDHLHLLSELT